MGDQDIGINHLCAVSNQISKEHGWDPELRIQPVWLLRTWPAPWPAGPDGVGDTVSTWRRRFNSSMSTTGGGRGATGTRSSDPVTELCAHADVREIGGAYVASVPMPGKPGERIFESAILPELAMELLWRTMREHMNEQGTR